MILAGDFKKGTKILFRDEPYSVLDCQHVKPGKGGAFIRTKMKNLITGLVREETFRSAEKLDTPDLAYKDMTYLYEEDGIYQFMDQDSYDQVPLSKNHIEDVIKYLKEQTTYTILYFGSKPIAVTPPMHMEFEVTQTVPGVRGDTVQGAATKPATLETGMVIQIPLFVEEGQIIKVDTRDGKYIERVDKKK